MKTSQVIVSAATALAVVGAVGFAVAQTTTGKPSSGTTNSMQNQNSEPTSTMPASPNTTGSGMNSASTGAPDANAPSGRAGAMNNGSAGAMNNGTAGSMNRGAAGSMNRGTAGAMNNGSAGATPNSADSNDTMSTQRPARADRN